ncbi:MAG: GLPGLI family protein [Saprospiraceae bacterium]|nr:GLPGLI family protein [Saprospiraceae bacterium]
MKTIQIITTTLLSVHFFFTGYSQLTSGRIEYDRTIYWTKMMDELPYLSKEELARNKLTWGNDDSHTIQYSLIFNEKASQYIESENQKGNNNQWSWRKEQLNYYLDLEKKTRSDLVEMPDKIYYVETPEPSIQWKIRSEIKEVNGYVCMSAETTDTVRKHKIVAWFTSEIPVSSGPEWYSGLPGMILELDIQNGACIITATNILHGPDLPSPGIPVKKKKYKIIDLAKLHQLQTNYINQCIASRRNPYWNLRY